MSYNKTTWINGDIITAQKLNNIEDGIENVNGGALSSPFIELVIKDNTLISHSWEEILSLVVGNGADIPLSDNNLFLLKKSEEDSNYSGVNYAGGIYVPVDRDYSGGRTINDITTIYFGSFLAASFPSQDREGIVFKQRFFNLTIYKPRVEGQAPSVSNGQIDWRTVT